MAYFTEKRDAFPDAYLVDLRAQILANPLLAGNNLTGDFVGTQGFSIVFRREAIPQVVQRFPWAGPYIETLLDADCNAFYLNPLILRADSSVAPHIDRSLRAYCRTIETPKLVSVLYVSLPEALRGGELVLSHGKRSVGRVTPQVNKVVKFQGDLLHSVTAVDSAVKGQRISLVCEQYDLLPDDLTQIPLLGLESKGKRY